MATPREILIDSQGRVMRRSEGDLATPDCSECCGGSTCARAFLCEETPDYANVHPKVIYFDCPENRRLCISPPGPWLVQYQGYCYQPNYDEDGLLVCDAPCASLDQDHVYVGSPAESLTCLPNKECTESPCSDPFADPECCLTGDLWCTQTCACDGATVCDCGKRWVVFWQAEKTYEYWANDCGKCYTTTWRGSGAMVVTGRRDPWGACKPLDVRYYGGVVKTTTRHDQSEYCPSYQDVPPGEWYTEWDGAGAETRCGWGWHTWPPEFGPIPDGGLGISCNYHDARPCNNLQSGYTIDVDGDVSCNGSSWVWSDVKTEESTCCLRERTIGSIRTSVVRLVECDESAGRSPPSLADLGLI